MNRYEVCFDYIVFEKHVFSIGGMIIPVMSVDTYHAIKEARCMFYNSNKANCDSGNIEILRIDARRVRK